MKLSKHFHLKEFIRSEYASRNGIDNTPSEEVIDNIKALVVVVLEPLRKLYKKPIYITSGYRCPELNKAIGGSINSQHMSGEAADIECDNNAKLFHLILKSNLPFDQLIWEFGDNEQPDWVHVSYVRHGKYRRKVLRAIYSPEL